MKQIDHSHQSTVLAHNCETEPAMPGSRILIVEDDLEIANVLRLRLRGAGYQVRTAHDGQQGLIEAGTFEPDAMILDLRMPVMDGLSVLRAMRQKAETQFLPVIVLSANVDGVSKRKAQELGARYFLDKPYEAARLLQLVKAVLDDKQSRTKRSNQQQFVG